MNRHMGLLLGDPSTVSWKALRPAKALDSLAPKSSPNDDDSGSTAAASLGVSSSNIIEDDPPRAGGQALHTLQVASQRTIARAPGAIGVLENGALSSTFRRNAVGTRSTDRSSSDWNTRNVLHDLDRQQRAQFPGAFSPIANAYPLG